MSTTDRSTELEPAPNAPRRVPPRRMPPASPRIMLKTSPLLRRLLPTPIVVRRAEIRGEHFWREHEPTRAHALRTMAAIVGGTHREPELEELAHRFVVESHAWYGLFWQPWPHAIVDARSCELLRATCAGERGVVVSSCHVGPFFGNSATLVRHGVELNIVSGDWWFEEPSHDYWGRRLARWSKGIPNVPLVRPRGTFATLAGLLERGASVLVYFDLPGRHETRFLGKPVSLVDGTARLAVEADAVVLPVRSRREGARVHMDVLEPLDPRTLDGVDGVQDELARVHERLILERPEEMNDPAEYGWGSEATASGWRRPPREREGATAG